MDMLCYDVPALKACSLTCKAMFASTRPLIHRRLRLPARKDLHILTRAEKSRPQGWNSSGAELRVPSYVTERGLLQYTQHVHIRLTHYSATDTTPPHLRHLQSLYLNRVHTLSIKDYRPVVWAKDFRTFFTHFHPTVTSLTLTASVVPYQHILRFALQFPMLQNLSLEWMIRAKTEHNLAVPTITHQSPPLCGHLRLAFIDIVAKDFTHELPNGMNFRSVELEGCSVGVAQHILNVCAHTLQSLTIVPRGGGACRLSFLSLGTMELLVNFLATGGSEFPSFRFTEVTALRRLTFHILLHEVVSAPEPLLRTLSTITSPVFCELVLEIPPDFCELAPRDWNGWKEIDKVLEERFATGKYFRLIIRTRKYPDPGNFQWHMKRVFPLLAGRGLIRFETFLDR